MRRQTVQNDSERVDSQRAGGAVGGRSPVLACPGQPWPWPWRFGVRTAVVVATAAASSSASDRCSL